ncbi:MAG: type II secretion system protein [Phycisphaerales bacterium]
MSLAKPRAFSLIELLVVIAIIGVIIALVIPAVGRVRDAAKNADNRALVSQIQNAVSAFQIDNRRVPGVFSPVEMGQADNETRGFSGMQNAMLELEGGVINRAPATARDAENEIVVGPYTQADRNVVVDLDLIGSGKGYLAPSGRSFKKQDGLEGGSRLGASGGSSAHERLPELVDRAGQPILFWSKNSLVTDEVESIDDVVALRSGGPTPSRFYWNQNAAFLAADAGPTGTLAVNQGGTGGKSMLGEWNSTHLLDSMMAFLGNPNSPVASTIASDTTPLVDVLPAQVRGSFVIHAAGRDGAYFSQFDSTSKVVLESGPSSGWIAYGINFYSPTSGGNGVRRSGAGPTSIDVGSAFDDIIAAGE